MVEITEPERHPADTLNDGSPYKFIFYVPALLLHTVIAGLFSSIVCSLAVNMLMFPTQVIRSRWSGMAIWYVLCLVMGFAWSRFLDRWLFDTSRLAWMLPAAWFGFYFTSWASSAGIRQAISVFFGRSSTGGRWVFTGTTLPLLCAAGYSVGAWIRRSSRDELSEAVAATLPESAWPETRRQIWSKAVKLWRAGRTIDYPQD